MTEDTVGRVYFIQGEDTKRIKIGFTTNSVESRVSALQTGSGEKLYVLATVPGTKAEETAYHERFKDHRLHGEWFEPCDELMRVIRTANLKPCQAAMERHKLKLYHARIYFYQKWHTDQILEASLWYAERNRVRDLPKLQPAISMLANDRDCISLYAVWSVNLVGGFKDEKFGREFARCADATFRSYKQDQVLFFAKLGFKPEVFNALEADVVSTLCLGWRASISMNFSVELD